jgi:Methane oxygenase PmoA
MPADVGALQLSHLHGRHFDVLFDGVVLARYVYAPDAPQVEAPKPYIEPIRTLAGDVVTAYRPHDHVWHKGIQFALPHVNEHNLYGGHTFVPDQGYLDLDNNGSMRHEGFEVLHSRGSAIEAVETLGWYSIEGTRLADERRAVTFDVSGAADGAWVIRFANSIANCGDDVVVFSSPTVKGRPNAGYGGLAWRGTRSFTGGDIFASGGRSGPELMGERGAWLGFAGCHDGNDHRSTVVFVDPAAASEVPTTWFVRTEPYAMIVASPFFHAEVDLPPGQSLQFSWAVIVASDAWEGSRVDRFIQAYAVDEQQIPQTMVAGAAEKVL